MTRAGTASFLRFVTVGAVAAAANIGARALFDLYMPFELAVALAYGIGLSVAFMGNRAWVFTGVTLDWRVSYWRFFLVNLVALAQVWLVSVGLYRFFFPVIGFTWHAELVAHIIGVASPMVTSYYAHKHYSFKGSET